VLGGALGMDILSGHVDWYIENTLNKAAIPEK
jgi:hypothetical protein